MLLRRWNPVTKQYEPYRTPEDHINLCYAADMDEVCNCAQCGATMRFGEGYTSLEVHTSVGFGYCVCDECHRSEIARGMILPEDLIEDMSMSELRQQANVIGCCLGYDGSRKGSAMRAIIGHQRYLMQLRDERGASWAERANAQTMERDA